MEPKAQITTNGQEFRQVDINRLGDTAALADDRTLAELLRFAPYTGTVARAILPFAHGASARTGTVQPTVIANGSVYVNPFRAVIGSRTAEGGAADANGRSASVKSWQDIQSGIYTGSATSRQGTVLLAANASGTNRWDLIQAVVTVDSNAAGAGRYVKDPTTRIVTQPSLVPYLTCSVSVSVVQGTPSATPTMPVATADAAGTYYIPLAYVRVPNGFGAASTVATKDIAMIAQQAAPSHAGAPRVIVPDQAYTPGGNVLNVANTTAWGNASASRPEAFMPPDLCGGEIMHIQASVFSAGNYTYVIDGTSAGSVIDSRDWRGRYFLVFAEFAGGAAPAFPQADPAPTATSIVGGAQLGNAGTAKALTVNRNMSQGQSISFGAAGKAFACYFDTSTLSAMAATSDLALIVDNSDSGKLKMYCPSGVYPAGKVSFVILSWGVYANAY